MTRLRPAIILGCVVSLFIITPNARGQEIRTSPHPVRIEAHGIVRFGDTRQPAANILVRLENHNGGMAAQALTDRDGKFLFSGLASRQYTLTVHAQGYNDSYQTVDLLTTTNYYVNIDLMPEGPGFGKARRTMAYIDATVPSGARKEFEKGEDAVTAKKYPAAIQHFENALLVHPQFFEAELSLGAAYMDLAQWDRAEASLRHASELNPKSPNAFFALGEIYLHNDRLAEAEKALRDGLRIENRLWKAHFALARVYWKKSDIANSARQLALTLQLNPDCADAHLLAGYIYLRASKPDEAAAEFRDYLRLAPKGASVTQAKDELQRLGKRLPASIK